MSDDVPPSESTTQPTVGQPFVREGSGRPLRMCIVDMNNGHANQAMRCFRTLVDDFFIRVQKVNPDLHCERTEVSPRDTNAKVPRDADLYLSSGGPGSPFDGDGDAWPDDYYDFLDGIMESSSRDDANARSLFAVCYSFEMVVRHFGVADIVRRNSRKFGVMPIYTTKDGQQHDMLGAFRDRLFAFEHRNWEVINLKEERLRELDGKLLARESRDGFSKGQALLGFSLGDGIETVQFHPEADRAGIMNWISRPEQAAAFRATYGEDTYQAMLRTIDDPNRLARTYAFTIPGWMARRFNKLAAHRGYEPVPMPTAADVWDAFARGVEPIAKAS